MPSFDQNLRRLQAVKKFSNKQLAACLGVDEARISKWRHGTVPEADSVAKIAACLEVEPHELLGDSPSDQWRHTTEPESNAEPYDRDIVRGYRKSDVPLVGDAEASTDGLIAWNSEGLVSGQIEEWVSRSFANGDPKAYALRVRGDSMVPRYFPGEVVVAQPRIVPRAGDYAVVMLNSGERLIKRVFRTAGGWRLHSENPLYSDREVADDEVHAIHPIRHTITPRH